MKPKNCWKKLRATKGNSDEEQNGNDEDIKTDYRKELSNTPERAA
jgi:hypothetical protein